MRLVTDLSSGNGNMHGHAHRQSLQAMFHPFSRPPFPPFFSPVDLVLEHVGVKDVEAKAVDEVAKHDGKDGHAGAIEPRAGDAAEDEELVFTVGIPGEERRWGLGGGMSA